MNNKKLAAGAIFSAIRKISTGIQPEYITVAVRFRYQVLASGAIYKVNG